MKTIFFYLVFWINFTGIWASDVQSEWLQKIEQYMNAARTWEAQFEQLNPNGSLYEGKFYLSRPGKMRLIYHYPKNQTLLADGKWLIIQDEAQDEITTLALKETPANFFLQETIRFTDQVKVTSFKIENGYIDVTVCRTDEPDAGTLTLVFSQKPLELIQWSILDSNQLQTTLTLKNIQRGQKINSDLFIFSRPDLLP